MIRRFFAWVARLALDWPFIAFAIVVLLILNAGPEWLFWVGVAALVVAGYLTRKRQMHWWRLRRMRRIWNEDGALYGVANRDGYSPIIKGFEEHDWGYLVTLQMTAGHSVEQIERAVPNLLPVFDSDLIRVERLSPSTVQLRCVRSTQLDSSEAGWQDNALAIPDPMNARPNLAEENDGWFTSEAGDLPR